MFQLYSNLNNLSELLNSFVKNEKIIPESTDKEIKYLDRMLKKEQLDILSKNTPNNQQLTIFNALRNIRFVLNEMNGQLKNAFGIGENPTTAERCLNVFPFMNSLVEVLCKSTQNKGMDDISRKTRILRRKAEEYNLLGSIENEMSEISLSNKEIKNFIDSFNLSIDEMGMEML